MIVENDFTRMKWARFTKKSGKAGDGLCYFIADVIKPDKLMIGDMRTDESGE